jgi:hypothetical protein
MRRDHRHGVCAPKRALAASAFQALLTPEPPHADQNACAEHERQLTGCADQEPGRVPPIGESIR